MVVGRLASKLKLIRLALRVETGLNALALRIDSFACSIGCVMLSGVNSEILGMFVCFGESKIVYLYLLGGTFWGVHKDSTSSMSIFTDSES